MAASPAAAWRPRGGRVGVAGADRDRTLSAHLLNFFFFRKKATYISLKVTVGFYDPIKKKNGRTDGRTDTLMVPGILEWDFRYQLQNGSAQ